LTTLQEVDRDIRERNQTKDGLLTEIGKREADIRTRKLEIEQLRAAWAEKDQMRSQKEKTLQEEGRKIMEKRMRMSRIKNIKELQALQREIDQIKQANAQMEEDLVRIMEEVEAEGASLKEKVEELAEAETSWEEKHREIQSRADELAVSIAAAAALRGEIAARLDPTLLSRYELIFSRRGGTAVVAVSDGICQGCFMNIPPQLLNETIKSESLTMCPSCHRILFHKPAVPNEKQL
jgi:predicted  nucleic acid-binding Zn-ribbon protein